MRFGSLCVAMAEEVLRVRRIPYYNKEKKMTKHVKTTDLDEKKLMSKVLSSVLKDLTEERESDSRQPEWLTCEGIVHPRRGQLRQTVH